jgi:hypothetical protein
MTTKNESDWPLTPLSLFDIIQKNNEGSKGEEADETRISGSSSKQDHQQQQGQNTTLSHCPQKCTTIGSRTTSNDEEQSSRLLLHLTSLAAFPWMLHRMLEDAEQQGFQDVVSWLPSDEAFIVHDQDRFMGTIAKTYFSQTHYKSFQRQLNIYGFQRITTSGPDKGGYTHEFLVRGEPEKCRFMVRTKIKGGMVRTTRKLSSPLTIRTKVPSTIPTPVLEALHNGEAAATGGSTTYSVPHPQRVTTVADEEEHASCISTMKKTTHPLWSHSSLICSSSRIQEASPIMRRTIPLLKQQFLSHTPPPLVIPAEIADEIIAIFGTGGRGQRRTTRG